MFKKRTIKAVHRNRKRNDGSCSNNSGSSSSDETEVVRKRLKRPSAFNRISSKTKQNNKDVSTDSDSNDEGSNDCCHDINVIYKSSNTTEPVAPKDMLATSTVQTESEKATTSGNKSWTKGPLKAPGNLRATVRWDYQPDLCKDFKETGYCGFGDSCKFLHDRTDYKFGWQLEAEENRTRDYSDDDDCKYEIKSLSSGNFPHKCHICRNSFTNPITTKCGHYFCEKCALQHYKTNKRCYICLKPTEGMFNIAKDLIQYLKEREL